MAATNDTVRRHFTDSPLVYSVLWKSFLSSSLLIVVHTRSRSDAARDAIFRRTCWQQPQSGRMIAAAIAGGKHMGGVPLQVECIASRAFSDGRFFGAKDVIRVMREVRRQAKLGGVCCVLLLLLLLLSGCSVPGGCTLSNGQHVDVLTCALED